ncbi:MAG: hypothetical protein AAF921_21165 [Cyanobacteria bacterium P01_D01_bin.44]
MTYDAYTYGYALDADDLDDDLDSADLDSANLDSANDSDTTVLLNGMTILFDQAVPVSPVSLIPKAKSSRHGSHV